MQKKKTTAELLSAKKSFDSQLAHEHAQQLQSAFCRIRVKDYFRVLKEYSLCDNELIERNSKSIDEYLKNITADHYYTFTPHDQPYTDDITIGELMIIISKLYEKVSATDIDYCSETMAQDCVETADDMLLDIFEPLAFIRKGVKS